MIGDIFRSDLSGFGKAAWLVFVIVLPFLGVLIAIRPPRVTVGRLGHLRMTTP